MRPGGTHFLILIKAELTREQDVLPMCIALDYVIIAEIHIADFKHRILKIVFILLSFFGQQLFQLYIAAMPVCGVLCPSLPYAVLAVSAADIQLAAIPICNQVDAFHIGQRRFPRGHIVIDNIL